MEPTALGATGLRGPRAARYGHPQPPHLFAFGLTTPSCPRRASPPLRRSSRDYRFGSGRWPRGPAHGFCRARLARAEGYPLRASRGSESGPCFLFIQILASLCKNTNISNLAINRSLAGGKTAESSSLTQKIPPESQNSRNGWDAWGISVNYLLSSLSSAMWA